MFKKLHHAHNCLNKTKFKKLKIRGTVQRDGMDNRKIQRNNVITNMKWSIISEPNCKIAYGRIKKYEDKSIKTVAIICMCL